MSYSVRFSSRKLEGVTSCGSTNLLYWEDSDKEEVEVPTSFMEHHFGNRESIFFANTSARRN